MTNDAILTKDNLIKRKWKGDPVCYFCSNPESIQHLFFQCPVAKTIWAVVAKCFGADIVPRNLNQCWRWCDQWLPFGKKFHVCGVAAIFWAIWKARNKACFDKVVIKSPLDIIYHACALMTYWAGLYGEMDREQLVEGINTMLKIAEKILKRKRGDTEAEAANRLQAGDPEGQDGASA